MLWRNYRAQLLYTGILLTSHVVHKPGLVGPLWGYICANLWLSGSRSVIRVVFLQESPQGRLSLMAAYPGYMVSSTLSLIAGGLSYSGLDQSRGDGDRAAHLPLRLCLQPYRHFGIAGATSPSLTKNASQAPATTLAASGLPMCPGSRGHAEPSYNEDLFF